MENKIITKTNITKNIEIGTNSINRLFIKRIAVCLVLFSVSFGMFAQAKMTSASEFPTDASMRTQAPGTQRTLAPNSQLAMSSGDYPVTAGDVYLLAFAAGSSSVNYSISVDTTYKIRVANLGVLNVQGLTFAQLKKQVEDIVAKNYPLSGVQFALSSPAVFQVTLKGEVVQTEVKQAWALTRLSTLVAGCFTNYSSSRDVLVTSANGKQNHYDLFLADRLGDLTQDPYVRPGDVITINRAERRVTVSGAIERPGSYELKKGENLMTLFEYYGGGFTGYADKNRIEIHRFNAETLQTSVFYLTEKDLEKDFALCDYDKVSVVASSDLRPVMFMEGAISSSGGGFSSETSTVASMDRISIRFDYDTNYASLLRSSSYYFLSSSDLSNAYIMRGDKIIPIDINKLLYEPTYFSEEIVQPYDVLRVPFKLYYVTVSGAVANPGRFAFIPDRGWEYYIGLAGGFLDDVNVGKKVEIMDVNGNVMKLTDPITPETTIRACSNRPSYQINRNISPWLDIITAIANTILAVVGIYGLFK